MVGVKERAEAVCGREVQVCSRPSLASPSCTVLHVLLATLPAVLCLPQYSVVGHLVLFCAVFCASLPRYRYPLSQKMPAAAVLYSSSSWWRICARGLT